MKIVQLQAENFKRLKAIDITPDESGAVIVSGRNAQGKSSVLDAIWAALGGREGNKVTKPVREGAAQAKVTVDLGDMVVTRIWRNDTTAVKVQSKDGAEFKSPQTLLDSFIGKLTFDPLAFTRLKDREQREALLGLVELDVDLEKLDAERQEAYEQRTEVGRAKSALGETPEVDPELPLEPIVASDLIAAMSAAAKVEGERASMSAAVDTKRAEVEKLRDEITSLEQRIATGEDEIASTIRLMADLPAAVDTSVLEQELADVEATNERIRSNNSARERGVQIMDAANSYAYLSERIAAIDEERTEALARAAFPVDGLGFDENGVTFNGVPFSQASSAEQIRVSLAMAMASNPSLRVIRIMDGSLLDDEGMKLIEEAAMQNDFQVWVERVANGDGVGFVIEDGEVLEDAA
ncbi:AAA family ATPase [Leucobacter sp. Z1108]|uniref:AAA family ATPase n=1 Tax=Leucobacter sp. Z1108 TaxID=3439066 RepID=UPI003F2C1CED